ncbi:MAG: HD domain-containing protein [Lachnospiraceae bacterium]
MKKIEQLLRHPIFLRELKQIEKLEQNRIYCGHNFTHLLDVARISWIIVLERGLKLEREVVYGAAFLHDLGRGKEYLEGISHDKASVEIAEAILPDCGFSKEDSSLICEAIAGHRHDETEKYCSSLQQVLREADWRSRNCFQCEARESCKWTDERKNDTIYF